MPGSSHQEVATGRAKWPIRSLGTFPAPWPRAMPSGKIIIYKRASLRVARGPKFVTAARNFKLTRPAAKFSARKKPATKLFGPQEARINIFGPLCKLLTIERYLGNPFMGVSFCKHK